MIAWHKLKHAKGLPRIMLQMVKVRVADARECQVRAQVYARDRRRCFFPNCRRASVDLAHIKARSLGGLFISSNLVSSCRQHHRFHHAGLITITGNPDRKTLKVRLTDLGRQAGLRLARKVA